MFKMKHTNRLAGKLIFLFAAFALMNRVSAQTDEALAKKLIESKQFVFHAQTAIPSSGMSKPLTSDYDLKVTTDKVVSYLPFYGRAYSLPYGSTDGGFNFTTTKFEYTSSGTKKGGWNVTIKPKDVPDFREFSLSLSKSGYGTLQVMTNNRQPMSFTGYITAIK